MIQSVECCRCHKIIKPAKSCSIRSSRPWNTHFLPVVRTDDGPVCFDCHAEEMMQKILPHLIKSMERIKAAAEKSNPKHAVDRD